MNPNLQKTHKTKSKKNRLVDRLVVSILNLGEINLSNDTQKNYQIGSLEMQIMQRTEHIPFLFPL